MSTALATRATHFLLVLALLVSAIAPASASTARSADGSGPSFLYAHPAAQLSSSAIPFDDPISQDVATSPRSQVHTYFVAAKEGAPAVWVHNTSLRAARRLARQAARAAGVPLGSLVDEVRRSGGRQGSWFNVINGRRVLNVGNVSHKTAAGKLVEVSHELAHAEQFARHVARKRFGGDVGRATRDFFRHGPGSRIYAQQERAAERTALRRVREHLGGLSPQQTGHSTRYIEHWAGP